MACDALMYFSDERIRQLAMDKLKSTKKPSIYLDLLVNNYKIGDDALLTDLVEKTDGYDAIHHLVFGLVDIYNANPSPLCKAPLEAIYHKMNCGLHRGTILKIMYENNVLSDKIFQEMQYDSDDDARALYRKIKKAKLDNTKTVLSSQT